MSELQWTFLFLGLLAILAQRSGAEGAGWRAWLGLPSFLSAAGLVTLLLDVTGWSPNSLWIAGPPIALAALADAGARHGKYGHRESPGQP